MNERRNKHIHADRGTKADKENELTTKKQGKTFQCLFLLSMDNGYSINIHKTHTHTRALSLDLRY